MSKDFCYSRVNFINAAMSKVSSILPMTATSSNLETILLNVIHVKGLRNYHFYSVIAMSKDVWVISFTNDRHVKRLISNQFE